MWHSLGGEAQRRWWKHYCLNSPKTPQGTPGVHPQTCPRDKHGPYEPLLLLGVPGVLDVNPHLPPSAEGARLEKRMWGWVMGQVWKDTLQVLLMQQQHGPVTTERLGSPLPRGENSWSYQQQWVLISIYLVFRYLLTLYRTPALCEQQPETWLSSILVWENLSHSTEDLLGSACHPRTKDKENIFWKFIEWF